MSSIRPLATIAVLAAVGVYLAHKINEGPAVALNDWQNPAGDAAGEPPAWDPAQSGASTIEEGAALSAVEVTTFDAPAAEIKPEQATYSAEPAAPFPTLPEEPAAETAAPAITATNDQLTLPENVPTANYGDSPTEPVTPSVAKPVGSSGFEMALEAARTALERDELPRALQMLSQWRGDASLSAVQRDQLDQLLSQLAGTVVYSADHRLEPAHVVAPGETLATIADQYDVPWQLLAKINGVSTVDGLQPGQQLKVLSGPFDAEIDLAKAELTLLLDDRYAGKFPVMLEGVAPGDGPWRVGQKRLDPSSAMQPAVVLENQAGERVEMSASPTAATPSRLKIASNDLADLYDILSVGSTVKIKR